MEEMVKARQMRSKYQVAYLFSTKNELSPWIRSAWWEKMNQRFFGSHRDVSPDLAAEFLHGRIVFLARSRAEWVAVVELDQPSSVASSEDPWSATRRPLNMVLKSKSTATPPCFKKPFACSLPEDKLHASCLLRENSCNNRMNAGVIPKITEHQRRRLYHPEPLLFHGPTSP